MNFRSRNMALVLCFFLGILGAHWYYLGRQRWGGIYLGACLLTSPLGWLVAGSIPLLGALLLSFVMLGQIGLFCIVAYDFFNLLCMTPQRFDQEFNP